MAEKQTFEGAMARLEEISAQLSQGALSLDESMDLYAEAAKLIAFCKKKLSAAQSKLEKVLATEPDEEVRP